MTNYKTLLNTLTGASVPPAIPQYLAKSIYDGIGEDASFEDCQTAESALKSFSNRFPWANITPEEIAEIRAKDEQLKPADYEDGTLVIKDGRFLYYVDGKIDTRAKTRERLESILMEKYGVVNIVMEILK